MSSAGCLPGPVGFLSKHYGLKHFTPQENNFVVFHSYFDGVVPSARSPAQDRNNQDQSPQGRHPSKLQQPAESSRHQRQQVSTSRLHHAYECQRADSSARQAAAVPENMRRRQPSNRESSYNSESQEVCQGMRGLLSRSSNGEPRTRVPMLPTDVPPVTQANYTSSRRRSSRKENSGNFLHHCAYTADTENIHTQRSHYEASCKTRQAKWWG